MNSLWIEMLCGLCVCVFSEYSISSGIIVVCV